MDDPDLMLISPNNVGHLVKNLAVFHAICAAFQAGSYKILTHVRKQFRDFFQATEGVSLADRFPLLGGGGGAWFEEDMKDFLQEMYETCHSFLKVRILTKGGDL